MPADTPPILTITMNPALDRTSEIAALRPHEKLRCSEPVLEPGGGGINVSRMIARLGGASTCFTVLGGYSGEMVRHLLQTSGIVPRVYEIEGATRENLTVRDLAGDTQYRFVMPGPVLVEDDWRGALEDILNLARQTRHVVASGSLPGGCPEDFFATLAKELDALDAELILDTSGPALEAAMERHVDVVKIDEAELRMLMSLADDDIEGEETAARALLEKTGARVIIVTLGARGALFVRPDGCERIVPPEIEAVSTVGAGDSFVAAFAHALAQGRTLRDACCFGVACGSAAVMTPGSELARREDVDRLYAQMCGGRDLA